MHSVEQTLGQRRVRASFNPSSNNKVDLINERAADLIDLIADYSNHAPEADAEHKRCLALAMTHIEDGAMWAVKGVT